MHRLFSTLMSVLLVFTLVIPNSVSAEYAESSGTASIDTTKKAMER